MLQLPTTYLNSSMPGRRLEDSNSPQSLPLTPPVGRSGGSVGQLSPTFYYVSLETWPARDYVTLYFKYGTFLISISPSPQLEIPFVQLAQTSMISVACVIRERFSQVIHTASLHSWYPHPQMPQLLSSFVVLHYSYTLCHGDSSQSQNCPSIPCHFYFSFTVLQLCEHSLCHRTFYIFISNCAVLVALTVVSAVSAQPSALFLCKCLCLSQNNLLSGSEL